MLLLTKEDIQAVFSMKDAIEADKEALRANSEGKASVPLRTNISVTDQNKSLYMPAYVGTDHGALGVKIVSVYPDNPQKGLPSVPATMIVLDPETGVVSGLLEGTYLTQLRTGAVQGAATDLLANIDAKIGALIGTGGQAASQLEAMLTVRKLEEVRIFDMDKSRREKFVEEMQQRFSVNLIPVDSAKTCVQNADIITTVTTSRQPTFEAEWVKEGAHINGIGAYTPEMKEVPADIIKKADVIVFDTAEGVLSEAGDFIDPLKAGLVTESAYTGELGDLLLGKIKGRQSEKDITIFKTVGTAVLDVVTASQIIEKAHMLKKGTKIDLG